MLCKNSVVSEKTRFSLLGRFKQMHALLAAVSTCKNRTSYTLS